MKIQIKSNIRKYNCVLKIIYENVSKAQNSRKTQKYNCAILFYKKKKRISMYVVYMNNRNKM